MTTRTSIAVASVTIAAIFLAGCSSESELSSPDANQVPSASQSESVEAMDRVAPVIIELTDLNDTVVETTLGRMVVINVHDHPEDWAEGGIDDDAIAEFVPGRRDDSAWFNPAFDPLQRGETIAHLTNKNTGEVVRFSLKVL